VKPGSKPGSRRSCPSRSTLHSRVHWSTVSETHTLHASFPSSPPKPGPRRPQREAVQRHRCRGPHHPRRRRVRPPHRRRRHQLDARRAPPRHPVLHGPQRWAAGPGGGALLWGGKPAPRPLFAARAAQSRVRPNHSSFAHCPARADPPTSPCLPPVLEAKVVVSTCGHDGPMGAHSVKRLAKLGMVPEIPGEGVGGGGELEGGGWRPGGLCGGGRTRGGRSGTLWGSQSPPAPTACPLPDTRSPK
jgi:hypothetical protein